MRHALIVRGGKAVISTAELRGAPARPGLVVRVERGAYGFEVMVQTAAAEDGCYEGTVLDVWGQIPCA